MTEPHEPSSDGAVGVDVMPCAERAADGPSAEGPARLDPRIHAAWRQWLAALATDAEAALAAAHVYAELPPEARDAWLDALEEDEPKLGVPSVAIYAPILSVETDSARRDRIERALGADTWLPLHSAARALRGLAADGTRIAALVAPLYLQFVRVLWCRYSPEAGFRWVRHDPILGEADAPADGSVVESVPLEPTPLKLVVEELAHAILAQRRHGLELPEPLQHFADLFDAQFDGEPFV